MMAIIEIDGKQYKVESGKMIIEVTDEVGIDVPRFCYHKKLSVAANCRMCLVQIENSKKPVPACATPITDGMKIYTQSEATRQSQKAVMEFLLINHPLDCPICDQGGECELQDISMGFGASESFYQESKRAVANQDLGSLISTEMTRCIHCTRCVRFGEEIAGMRELGSTGRGENMNIGTYVQHVMKSEISGNIIDLCPVGALTSKPYRFTARSWEMTQYPAIAIHDCLGSHVYVHVRRNQIMRVAPRACEDVNEVWLSDRDRFSYLGLNHPSRALFPQIKRHGQWEQVDWETALQFTAAGIQNCIQQYGEDTFVAFASPSTTLEEYYLLKKWMKSLQVQQFDCWPQATDLRDKYPLYSTLASPAQIEKQNYIFIIGSHLHREVPLLATRVRKAFLAGARIDTLNPCAYEFPFHVTSSMITTPDDIVVQLATILSHLVDDKTTLPQAVQTWMADAKPSAYTTSVAEALKTKQALIISGHISENHPHAALLRTLVYYICQHTTAQRLCLTVGANALGAALVGITPTHPTRNILFKKLKGAFLLNVTPNDFTHAFMAHQALSHAEFVVALTGYDENIIKTYAQVILPVGLFTEITGTYINVFQHWQTMSACVPPPGEARPAWKILHALAQLMHSYNAIYTHEQDILAALKTTCTLPIVYEPCLSAQHLPQSKGLIRLGEWPLYSIDAIVRHASALQEADSTDALSVRMHPDTVTKYQLDQTITVSQNHGEIHLPLVIDDRVAREVVCLPYAMSLIQYLDDAWGKIQVR